MADGAAPVPPADRLQSLGWPREQVEHWSRAFHQLSQTGEIEHDWQVEGRRIGNLVSGGWALLQALPPRSRRGRDEGQVADELRRQLVEQVRRYCARHGPALFDAVAANRAAAGRLEDWVEAAAQRVPGAFPTRGQLADEARLLQKDKDGLELLQGALCSEWLNDPRVGLAIIEAMQRPLPASGELAQRLVAGGRVELERATVTVDGNVGRIEFSHPVTLNAEDESTLPDFEQAVDALLLTPGVQMGVLRGAPVAHPKYAGRRLFSAGINLTALYEGAQSYLWYLTRELGALNKILRGLITGPPVAYDEYSGHEIPWMAVVEGFAIGGGCQILLVVDHVLAEAGAYFNLPARKEGIIPGCANLRMPAFLGLRASQAGILFGRVFRVEEPAAAGLIDAVCEGAEMEAGIADVVRAALDSGMVSAAGNRRALRCGHEPVDAFRRYLALYAWEQAWCHLSPQLAQNLERHWIKAQAGQAP